MKSLYFPGRERRPAYLKGWCLIRKSERNRREPDSSLCPNVRSGEDFKKGSDMIRLAFFRRSLPRRLELGRVSGGRPERREAVVRVRDDNVPGR